MSKTLLIPNDAELAEFHKTVEQYKADLESFFKERIEVKGLAEPTADGNKMQAACLAMASLVGCMMGQIEAAMPLEATERERLDLMYAFINMLAPERGMTLTMLGAPDPVEQIAVITSSMKGKEPSNYGFTEPPTEPTGGQNAHPYLH